MVLVGQISLEAGQRPVPPATQPRSRDPQRQRQKTAQPHDLRRRRGFHRDPPRPGKPGKQLDSLVRFEDVQIDQPGAGQPSQPGSAGDQHRAPWGAR
jgi:hypothetical protein